MAHFVKVRDGIVVDGMVADQSFIDSMVDTSPGQWIQTSYNTHGGVHDLGGKPLRKNYAGIGYSYDPERDAFIPPMPTEGTWVLDPDTCLWVEA